MHRSHRALAGCGRAGQLIALAQVALHASAPAIASRTGAVPAQHASRRRNTEVTHTHGLNASKESNLHRVSRVQAARVSTGD
ncbi:unnamed protein product [Colias eurytheme]|nr:unnamed protein product [Colias eurytheme]